MATTRQMIANRLNAQKATGPRTDAGKAGSRGNALTHGLTARVMPLGDTEAVNARAEELAEALGASNAQERLLVRWIAEEDDCLRRCRAEQQAYRQLRALRASVTWDDDRRLKAETRLTRLDRQPAVVRRQLEQTPQGCAALLERWRGLEQVWALRGEWTEVQVTLALDLLGVAPELRDGAPDPDLDQARREIERLEHRRTEVLAPLDRAEKALTETEVGPLDATLKLYQRYEAASRRRLQWALDQLPPPAPSGEPSMPEEGHSEPLYEPEEVSPEDDPAEFSADRPGEPFAPWTPWPAGVSYVPVSAARPQPFFPAEFVSRSRLVEAASGARSAVTIA